MPRLIRRTPLLERIKANLDFYDLSLWIWEELNDDAYDEWIKLWATPIGIALNLIFIIARGASRPGEGNGADDVFGDVDEKGGSGWIAWFVSDDTIPSWKLVMGDYANGNDAGCFYRSLSFDSLLPECILHLHTQTTLPLV
jgi:hypothetical protein